jgi:hypothetical protein
LFKAKKLNGKLLRMLRLDARLASCQEKLLNAGMAEAPDHA